MSDWMRKILYYENILEFKEKTKSLLRLEEVHNWKLCRTCLKEMGDSFCDSADLGSGGSSMNVMGLDVHLIQPKDMLRETTGIEITPSERMPMRICKECLSKASIFYLFKMQTKRSETVLKRMLAKLDESQAESDKLKKCTWPDEITATGENCSETIIRINRVESLQTAPNAFDDESQALRKTCGLTMETSWNSQDIKCTKGQVVAMVQIHEDFLGKHEVQVEEGEQVPAEDVLEELRNDEGNQNLELYSLDIERDDMYVDHDDDNMEAVSEPLANAPPITKSATCSKPQRKRSVSNKSLLDNLMCAVCNETFPLQRMLISHVYDSHPNRKAFKCRFCQKMFAHLQSLSRHMQTHLLKQFKNVCYICDKSFQRLDDWRRHLRTHTGERPYVCNICHKSFKQHSELKEHVSTHSTDRRFECSICGHCLLSRNGLYIHKKVHEGEKHHKCPHCSKRFTTKGELKSHQNVHSKLRKSKRTAKA